MLGHVDILEAVVWVQTTEPARVQLRYGRPGWKKMMDSEVLETDHKGLLIARFVLTALEENTTYNYQVLINGKVQQFDYPLSFKTQPHWKWRTDPPEISFAFGSCFFVNDPPYDRPGEGYGGEFEILDVIADQKPDFMIWGGDNIYLRESDFYSVNRINYRNKHARSYPPLQPLLAQMAHYATWDDHDYGPNDADRSYGLKAESLDIFKAYWANPQWGMPDAPGVFGLMAWGDVDFFFLDNRYYRAPNDLDDPNKPYLGEKQMQWLKDSLLNSHATFKIIVNGNQVMNHLSRHEGMVHYPREYHELVDFLKEADVDGVLFLTGDRHFTELQKVQRSDNYPIYDFTSSPLTSGITNDFKEPEVSNPNRVEGTLVIDKRNFGLVRVEGKRKERVLVLMTYDSTGAKRWEHRIHENELKRRTYLKRSTSKFPVKGEEKKD